MIEMILEKFTTIISKCLDRCAKEENADKQQMALVFKLWREDEVRYFVAKDFKLILNEDKVEKELTFTQVLGVRIDFKGYSLFVPKFIAGALNRFCVEESINRNLVSVVALCDDKNEVKMFLYDEARCVKGITLESLFEPTDIIK